MPTVEQTGWPRTFRSWRPRVAVVLLLAAASLTGCVFPGDANYSAYAAKIGDSYYMYIPLCENERVDGVELYVASDSVEESADFYWRAEDPTNTLTEQGWIRVGDNESFTQVAIVSEEDFGTFDAFTLTVWSDDADHGFRVSGVFFPQKYDYPEYPADADPKTVKYGTEYGRETQPREITPEQARKESPCAGQYVA